MNACKTLFVITKQRLPLCRENNDRYIKDTFKKKKKTFVSFD